jgi:hypothetical protein
VDFLTERLFRVDDLPKLLLEASGANRYAFRLAVIPMPLRLEGDV